MQPSVDIEDHSGLVAYLRETGHIQPGELVRCTNLSGGISNRAVLVQRSSGETWVLKQALPKLRVTVDWFSDPARIEREALGLTWLGKLAPPGSIPHLVFEDRAHHLLAMQAVPQPHENWKTRLLAGRVEAAYVTQFAELLVPVELSQSGVGYSYARRNHKNEPYLPIAAIRNSPPL